MFPNQEPAIYLEEYISIESPTEALYSLLRNVANHARFIPDYIDTQILSGYGQSCLIERQAKIEGCVQRWQAMVTFEHYHAIHFTHIEGRWRGMKVLWEIQPEGVASRLRIVHEFADSPWWKKAGWWPIRGRSDVKRILEKMARATLAGIKKAAEQRTSGGCLESPLSSGHH
jgi:ribosome-associated toxin RatA of RatAB toxin-antitoxin module